MNENCHGPRKGVFIKEDNYPKWNCRECAIKYGGKYPPGHISSWHQGTCGVCGEEKSVTEPRDYGYPNYPKSLNKGK